MNKSRISWITKLPWWYAIFWLVIAIFLYHYQWPHLGNIKIPNVSLPRYHVRRTKLINDNPFGTVACLKWIFQYYYMRSSKKHFIFYFSYMKLSKIFANLHITWIWSRGILKRGKFKRTALQVLNTIIQNQNRSLQIFYSYLNFLVTHSWLSIFWKLGAYRNEVFREII